MKKNKLNQGCWSSYEKRHWNRVKTTFFTTGGWNSPGAITVNEMISFFINTGCCTNFMSRKIDFHFFIVTCAVQGRDKVGWRPGQEASSGPPYSKLRSFGSICSTGKEVVLVTLLGVIGAPAAIGRSLHWFGAPIVLRTRELHP